MRITAININRNYGGNNEFPFKCEVHVEGEYGTIHLKVPDDKVQAILASVADIIVDAGQQTANLLTKQMLDHKALEHTSE